MACDVCNRQLSLQRRACCASCVKAALYEPRLQQISALLEREKYHTHAEAVVRPGNDGILASLPQDADWDAIAQGIKTASLQRQRQELEIANDKIATVMERVAELKRHNTQLQDQINAMHRSNAQREKELGIKKVELERITSSNKEPLQTAVRKASYRLQRTHLRSADAKAQLCYTASLLIGVKQEVDHRRKLSGRFMLGGLVVPDLRELAGPLTNATMPRLSTADSDGQHFQLINTCLDNICRLIATWCHYLSISLPAEIILPHSDFPHAAILPEKSSYRGGDVHYPGGSSSQNTSPSASRLLSGGQNTARPRLLHLDRPLARLAQEDVKAFGLFVEGVTLLSWDLAWLCKTQGVAAINTYDEFCDIGRNLWLFHRAAETRASESSAVQTGMVDSPPRMSRTPSSTGMRFGTLTHGTVMHSLSGHEGAAAMQGWRLSQPHRINDKLRSFLLTEVSGAEWDVLSDRDFDDDREDEVAVLVGGNRTKRPTTSRAGTMSVMSIAPLEEGNQKTEKGWTKLRGRGNDT